MPKRIRGVVLSSDGATPQSGVVVEAFDPSTSFTQGEETTDERGQFVLADLEERSWIARRKSGSGDIQIQIVTEAMVVEDVHGQRSNLGAHAYKHLRNIPQRFNVGVQEEGTLKGVRTQLNLTGTGGSAVTDDPTNDRLTIDHSQYVFVDGTRPLTGDWDNITRRIRNTGVVEVSAVEPSTPADGLLWLDTSTGGVGVLAVATITGDTTLTAAHTVVLCDASLGAITVALPAAVSHEGRRYFIKKIDGTGNAIIVDGNGSETIDDATTQVITGQDDCMAIVCDAAEWWII